MVYRTILQAICLVAFLWRLAVAPSFNISRKLKSIGENQTWESGRLDGLKLDGVTVDSIDFRSRVIRIGLLERKFKNREELVLKCKDARLRHITGEAKVTVRFTSVIDVIYHLHSEINCTVQIKFQVKDVHSITIKTPEEEVNMLEENSKEVENIQEESIEINQPEDKYSKLKTDMARYIEDNRINSTEWDEWLKSEDCFFV